LIPVALEQTVAYPEILPGLTGTAVVINAVTEFVSALQPFDTVILL
jgi:hypothetical protein